MRLTLYPRRLAWFSLGLLATALLVAACLPGASTPSPATDAPPAPTPAQVETDKSGIQVGVDADGNFYRGNPNAAVKLVEFSDFQ